MAYWPRPAGEIGRRSQTFVRRCNGTAGTPRISISTQRLVNSRSRREFRFDSPERHIHRAVELRNANEYESAIFEFSRATAGSAALAATARREVAPTRMTLGLASVSCRRVSVAAVTNWELALAEDPSLIYVLPYLARGYYDLGRYKAGIERRTGGPS